MDRKVLLRLDSLRIRNVAYKLRSNDNERSVDGRRVYHYAGFWEDAKEKASREIIWACKKELIFDAFNVI